MSRKAATVTEDELLQRRLRHAQWLSGMLQDRGSLAAQTVAAYTGVVVWLVGVRVGCVWSRALRS
jgi:hypothetical protein